MLTANNAENFAEDAEDLSFASFVLKSSLLFRGIQNDQHLTNKKHHEKITYHTH